MERLRGKARELRMTGSVRERESASIRKRKRTTKQN